MDNFILTEYLKRRLDRFRTQDLTWCASVSEKGTSRINNHYQYDLFFLNTPTTKSSLLEISIVSRILWYNAC